jgi:hypothetical protein
LQLVPCDLPNLFMYFFGNSKNTSSIFATLEKLQKC